MYFDHERLDVYQRAMELLSTCDLIIQRMPRGRSHLKDQLDRAATSVVLNIAEGAGEYSIEEKRRFYRIAQRSATESAAILHIIEHRHAQLQTHTKKARELLARTVAMLVRLGRSKPNREGIGHR